MAREAWDLLGSYMDGQARREETERKNRLASLSGAAYSAEPEGRQNALNELANVDASAAMKMEEGLTRRDEYTRDQIAANREDVLRGISILERLPPMEAAQQWPQLVASLRDPMMRQLLGQKRYEDIEPMIPQIKQQLMAQSQGQDEPAAFRAKHMQALAAGYQQGTPEYEQFMRVGVTSARPAVAKIEMLDDGTAIVLDANTGSYRRATPADTGGQPAPQPGAPVQQDDSALVDQVGQQGMAMIETLVQRGIPRPEAEAMVEPMMQSRLGAPRMQVQPAPAPAQAGPSKADTARAVTTAQEEAKAAVEKNVNRPKARRAIVNARQNTANVQRSISQALPNVNVWTSGFVGKPLSIIPGTAAANLRASIDTIEANMGFDALEQMRATSPTGGALGNITERELELLQSRITSLKNSQSPQQLASNLRYLEKEYQEAMVRLERAYQEDYGDQQSAPAGQPPSNDAKRRALLEKY